MASNDIFQEIQDDLSCPVCKNQLSQPKALPCQHTFCFSCLQELARLAKNGQFHCPQCRKIVDIPAEGVQAFPTNFLVANILEKFREKKRIDNCTIDLCTNHRKEAHVVCTSCNAVACNACIKSRHHKRCLLENQGGWKNIRQEKATKLKELKNLMKKSMDGPQDLSHVKQRLQERHKDVRRQIESRAAVVIHQVESKKTSLLNELDQQRERKLNMIHIIEAQYDALRRFIPAENAISSNEPLSYRNMSSAVTNLKDAISRGNVYYAKRAFPLLGEVGNVKFERSKVEQPLLGHIVEGSNSPSGSKSSSRSKADTNYKNGKKRSRRVIVNPAIISNSEDEDSPCSSVGLKRRKLRKSTRTLDTLKSRPVPSCSASSSRSNQSSASASASTSRSSQT
ncbi:E3 ubiquitin-protein ligase TRIM63-like [Branchiostoma lanceolatum]|uniref:E3 ubiquitin-protein ligase TRIM63-like n=1 Tax=Branchiostoma lanceolatum TaxID=7740 RepID=UPI0034531C3F